MKKYVLIILCILFFSRCSITPSGNSREITSYWGPNTVPQEISIDIITTSTGELGWEYPFTEGGWWFSDFQGFPMELILRDQTHALMASPYIDRETKNNLLWNSENPDNPSSLRNIPNPKDLSTEKGANEILWISFNNTYESAIPWNTAGAIMLSGVPNNKKISLSYPLVLPTEITYYSGDIDHPTADPNWSPYRSNRITKRTGNTWSVATGLKDQIKSHDNTQKKSIVKSWIREGEVNNLDEIRIRIFPEEYDENMILPLVKISSSWVNLGSFFEKIDIFFEKDGKIIDTITEGYPMPEEEISNNDIWKGNILVLKNLSHKNIDTIILKKVNKKS